MKLNRQNYNNIWFTADWHIGHDRPFIVEARGFSSIQEHDEYIMDTFNTLVDPKDIVFHLGDLTMGGMKECGDIFSRINAKNINCIIGNHDKGLKNYVKRFPKYDIGQFLEIRISDDEIKYPITLCHYPMLSWNRSHYGAWNLCGHSHGSNTESLPDCELGKRLDVSVDVGLKFNDKIFFTFEDVKSIMDSKLITEHH